MRRILLSIHVIIHCIVFASSGFASQTALPHTTGNVDDSFGEAVAIDGTRILIGAPYIDTAGSQAGAVYSYGFDGSTWSQNQVIIPSDVDDLDFFGATVVLDGDVAAMGAFGVDAGSGFRSGAVYLFRNDGSSWNQDIKLTDPAGNSQDDFGLSLAISSDFLFVGAPGDDDNGLNSGSVFVYRSDGSTWSFESKLTEGSAGDSFGNALSVDGSWLAIGAYSDDESANDSGATYLFYYNGSNWVFSEKIKPGDPHAGSFFGHAVALDGQQLLIGAPNDNEHGISSGSVYVFSFDSTSWVQQEKLSASDSVSQQQYGSSLDISRKFAVVGAPNDSEYGVRAGGAYLLFYNERTWVEMLKFNPSDSAPFLQFGYAVALTEEFAIAGAPWDKDETNQEGRVYIFDDITSFKPIPSLSHLGIILLISAISGYILWKKP